MPAGIGARMAGIGGARTYRADLSARRSQTTP